MIFWPCFRSFLLAFEGCLLQKTSLKQHFSNAMRLFLTHPVAYQEFLHGNYPENY